MIYRKEGATMSDQERIAVLENLLWEAQDVIEAVADEAHAGFAGFCQEKRDAAETILKWEERVREAVPGIWVYE